jgi:hypothetical protein
VQKLAVRALVPTQSLSIGTTTPPVISAPAASASPVATSAPASASTPNGTGNGTPTR